MFQYVLIQIANLTFFFFLIFIQIKFFNHFQREWHATELGIKLLSYFKNNCINHFEIFKGNFSALQIDAGKINKKRILTVIANQ